MILQAINVKRIVFRTQSPWLLIHCNEASTGSWPIRDAKMLAMRFGSMTAAIERNKGGIRKREFADWAMARAVIGGGMKPAVNTGPAIKMAAESDHWVSNKF